MFIRREGCGTEILIFRKKSVRASLNCKGGRAASVNLIWPLLIFSFGPTPLVIHHSAPGRSEALRSP